MPFSGTTFSNVAGASSAATGQTVQSAVWNSIFVDYAAALTQLNSQYASVNTNRNILWMNGGLEIWQRGAGASSSIAIAASAGSPYTADRWYVVNGANQAMNISAQAGLSSQSLLSGKFQRSLGQTGTGTIIIAYPLDTDEIVRMRGKKVALSLLVKTGVNYSTNGFSVNLYVGTGAVSKRGAGSYTNETNPISIGTSAFANTLYSVSGQSTATIPLTTTQAELQISFTPSGTAGADDSIYIDDVSLEVCTSASTWTPMNYDRLPFHEMLTGCKRHYQKTFQYSVAPANAITTFGGVFFNPQTPGVGDKSSGTKQALVSWNLPVELRVTPLATGGGSYVIYNPVNNSNGTLYATTGENPNGTSVSQDAKILSIQVSALSATTGDYQVYAHFTISADI